MHNPYDDQEEERLEKQDRSQKIESLASKKKLCIQSCPNSHKAKGKEAVCSFCSYNELRQNFRTS